MDDITVVIMLPFSCFETSQAIGGAIVEPLHAFPLEMLVCGQMNEACSKNHSESSG